MSMDFKEALDERRLVFDGGMGTMLQELGLKAGGCPDELNITEPELIKKVHSAYLSAGANVVTTNTFGANRIKLEEYGLEGRLEEINIAAVKNARSAVGDNAFIAGDIGPSGRFIEPVGDMSFEEAVEIFTEQAEALKKGGADLFIIETMMDIKEMRAAIIAATSVGLPVVATMTFDNSMRTILGTSPEAFAAVASALGVAALGANCSLGIEGIFDALSAMSKVTDLPLIAQANAGIPVLNKAGETTFPATPSEMADYMPKLADIGTRIVGGCCGTTDKHIEAMGKAFLNAPEKTASKDSKNFTALASRGTVKVFGPGLRPVTIGERINPTGKKTLAEEIKEGKTTRIRAEAKDQTEAGADLLDVNVGVPNIDEPSAMKRAVFAVNENSTLPIVVDSSDLTSLEEGLKAVDGRALINSVSGEEEKLATVLPLAKKYGAAVLGLTLDDDGIPQSAEGRVKVAKKILDRALKAGLRKEDIVIDCLAMTVSAEPKAAKETLRAIRMVTEDLGLATTLGVSNISFGLPARGVVNSNFFAMAIDNGLTSAIINVKNEAMMDAFFAACTLLGYDPNAEGYIDRFRERTTAETTTNVTKKAPQGIREEIANAVVEGSEDEIVALVERALSEGIAPLAVGNEALILGLDEVGRLFASNRYFLPQVILSADTVKKGFNRLKKEMLEDDSPKLGRVILATVEGDIHDIGKNILCTLLENHGFDVIDLGKNVSAETIIETVREKEVDVVGLSALMTTTVMGMETVINSLKEAGLGDVKTIVGGAVVTEEFAGKIGADAFGGEATEAVDKIKALLKVNVKK